MNNGSFFRFGLAVVNVALRLWLALAWAVAGSVAALATATALAVALPLVVPAWLAVRLLGQAATRRQESPAGGVVVLDAAPARAVVA